MAVSKSTPEDRFWAKVRKSDGCWLWSRPGWADGYGQTTFKHQRWFAHRLSYTLAVGPIPDGLFVCHHCDVRLCVRPDHLFLGTQTDNLRDASRKGRMRTQKITHCPKGHAYTPENTYNCPGKYPQRRCLTCRKGWAKSAYARGRSKVNPGKPQRTNQDARRKDAKAETSAAAKSA